jgi:ElaB/YqjD/DUF883 family membrane-anchored ribosome-binding protein
MPRMEHDRMSNGRGDSLAALWRDWRRWAESCRDRAESAARERPWSALLVAAIAGFLLGWILGRRR